MMAGKVAFWAGRAYFGQGASAGDMLTGDSGSQFDLSAVGLSIAAGPAPAAGTLVFSHPVQFQGLVESTIDGFKFPDGTTQVTAATAYTPPSIDPGEVVGNSTGAPAAPVGNTISAMLDAAIGSSPGSLLGRGATEWEVIAPGSSGDLLTSAGAALPAFAAPATSYAYKTSDQSIASTATFTDVTSLSFAVTAGMRYAFQANILLTCGAGGIQIGVNGPTLTSLIAGATSFSTVTAYDISARTSAAAVSIMTQIYGTIICSADGTFSVRFRQDVSDVANTTIQAGSSLWYSIAA